MLLSDIETMVRQDLFDPIGGANLRWQTSDIDRAIDKAVDRYSQYYPNIVYTDLAAQPYQRTYAYPQPWNASYPVWWIERILYPLQAYGSYFAPPGAGMAATAVAGAGLGIGVYHYAVTLLSQGGESTPSPLVTATTSNGNQQVNLSAIPLGPLSTATPGIATNTVIGRNLYRTTAGGAPLYLLATLQDNVTTSFSDTAGDNALSGKPAPPTVNTSGVMLWPPYEREFAEYSNIFDSSAALAAGGNMGAQGSIGAGASPTGSLTPSFTLKLSSAELPQDATLVMRIFYATKHQLDANGSTIPEAHRDIIVLGAAAYALEAYQVPTNDNLDGAAFGSLSELLLSLLDALVRPFQSHRNAFFVLKCSHFFRRFQRLHCLFNCQLRRSSIGFYRLLRWPGSSTHAWYNQRYDITDIIEFDVHCMTNASDIGRSERTPSLGYLTDRKRFTDFGASARRSDGKPDGGDVFELRATVNAHQSVTSKPETMRELARQLVSEAREALESAAHCGEQPPPWVQAFMSPTGWEHYRQLRNEAGRRTRSQRHTLGR